MPGSNLYYGFSYCNTVALLPAVSSGSLSWAAALGAAIAVATALGFLLLLPLQTIAGLQTSRTANNAQAARI